MFFLLHHIGSEQPSLQLLEQAVDTTDADSHSINSAHDLLLLYVETAESSRLYPLLQQIRDHWLHRLDLVSSSAEIHGLIFWLLHDLGIDHRGETLEDTAERLSDMDIEQLTDTAANLLFILHNAVERIDELELDN